MKLPKVAWNCFQEFTGVGLWTGPFCAMPTKAAMSVRIEAMASLSVSTLS